MRKQRRTPSTLTDPKLQSAAAAKHATQACRSMLGELQQESIRRQLTCGGHEQWNRFYQLDEIFIRHNQSTA